jgi:hypothetical protein
MTDLLYQHSDNVISVPIVDDVTGEAIPASNFSDAEYIIATKSGNVRLRLSLNQGIVIDGSNFKITIDDGAIDKSFRGAMVHQLVVYNQAGDKLPPVFKNNVKISSVIL